ncbi:hypothetical protein [Nitrosovibrio tenuis]|uniref:hypothetical protein n=1 Tax=Nitrosovibrio tenuis TaxID=1233 RepID=UPI000B8469A0|nr:hypothetical protein [Nitrosovibrio tenuis]
MKNSILKSTVLATALVFVVAGTAYAQGYSADQIESPAPYGGSAPGSDAAGKKSDYGTSGSGERGQYGSTQRPSGDKYGGSYQGSARDGDNDLYDHSPTNGTGPRLKGRY